MFNWGEYCSSAHWCSTIAHNCSPHRRSTKRVKQAPSNWCSDPSQSCYLDTEQHHKLFFHNFIFRKQNWEYPASETKEEERKWNWMSAPQTSFCIGFCFYNLRFLIKRKLCFRHAIQDREEMPRFFPAAPTKVILRVALIMAGHALPVWRSNSVPSIFAQHSPRSRTKGAVLALSVSE